MYLYKRRDARTQIRRVAFQLECCGEFSLRITAPEIVWGEAGNGFDLSRQDFARMRVDLNFGTFVGSDVRSIGLAYLGLYFHLINIEHIGEDASGLNQIAGAILRQDHAREAANSTEGIAIFLGSNDAGDRRFESHVLDVVLRHLHRQACGVALLLEYANTGLARRCARLYVLLELRQFALGFFESKVVLFCVDRADEFVATDFELGAANVKARLQQIGLVLCRLNSGISFGFGDVLLRLAQL